MFFAVYVGVGEGGRGGMRVTVLCAGVEVEGVNRFLRSTRTCARCRMGGGALCGDGLFRFSCVCVCSGGGVTKGVRGLSL